MTLAAWRERWVWLAIGLCGGGERALADPPAKVSIFDAPPLAGATYAAAVATDPDPTGNGEPQFAFERGAYHCAPLLQLLHGMNDFPDGSDVAVATKACPIGLGLGMDHDLNDISSSADHAAVAVVDKSGNRLATRADILKAASPIDSPAKALLAVWLDGRYGVTWYAPGKPGEPKFHGGVDDGHVRATAGGFEVDGVAIESSCNRAKNDKTITQSRATLLVDAAGKVTLKSKVAVDTSHEMCVVQYGRRPADFLDVAVADSVRGELLRALHHEAESVRAFERLGRELAHHGAPAELVAAAARAAVQERDHAERCARLVGEAPAIAPDDRRAAVRELEAIAIENAREGCVGEAYAALANAIQARTAATAELRAHYAAIAADELAHAALAHAVHDWCTGQLDAAARTRVAAASDHALDELARAVANTGAAAAAALGMPTGARAAQLIDAVAAPVRARL